MFRSGSRKNGKKLGRENKGKKVVGMVNLGFLSINI